MTMHRVKQLFRQEPHCCSDEDCDATVELELIDGGGGEFMVLRTTEWAIDDAKELAELVDELKAMMKTAKTAKTEAK